MCHYRFHFHKFFLTNFSSFVQCVCVCVSIAIVRLPMDGRSFVFIIVICWGGCVFLCVSVHSITMLFNVNVVQMRFRLKFFVVP